MIKQTQLESNQARHSRIESDMVKKESILVKLIPNTSVAGKGALAHRLQHRTACKIENGRQGAPKWPTGSGKVSTPRFLGASVNFC